MSWMKWERLSWSGATLMALVIASVDRTLEMDPGWLPLVLGVIGICVAVHLAKRVWKSYDKEVRNETKK